MTVKPYAYSIIAVFVLAFVLAGCKNFSNNSDSVADTSNLAPTPIVDPKDVYISQLTNFVDVSASRSASTQEKQLIDGQTSILADVNGGSLRGEGGIYRNFGVYNVYAKSYLDKPSDGSFYQGWVANPTNNSFFSIGKLETDSSGQYQVTYNSDNIHPGFDRIIVTLETTDDNTPEKHILEGSLSNAISPQSN